jgi:hypothetical protein
MIDKSAITTALRSPKTKKHGLRALVAFLAIGILGFFVLPPIVKSVLLEKLGAALHRPVSVQHVSINPYTLSLEIDGVAIQEKGGGETVAGFDKLFINLDSGSLFRGGPVVSEFRLDGPRLKIVRLADNRYNFSDLIEEMAAKPASDAPAPSFSLNNIQITGGTVEFEDRPVDEKHVLSDINLALPFVSNMAHAIDTFVEPAFSAKFNGATLAMKGKSKPFADSHESELVLDLNDLQLGKYLDYSPYPLPLKVISGGFDSDLKITFRQQKDKPSILSLSGTVALKDLQVKESSDAPLVAFKRLDVTLGSVDLLSRKFVIDRVAIDSPVIHARMGRQGTINWLGLLPKTQAADKPAVKAGGKPAPSASPVAWSVTKLSVSGGTVRWLDESHEQPVRANIDGLALEVDNLSLAPGQTSKLATSFKLNDKGTIDIGGDVKLLPFEADLKLNVKTVELLPLQPYFTEKLNVSVTRGQVTLDGGLQVQRGADGVAGGFSGQLTIGDFNAVDKINSADFLRWKSLYFGNVDLRLNPDSVSIGEVALADFFARVIVSPQGKLNLLQIVRKNEPVAAEPATPAEPVVAKPVEQVKPVESVKSGGGKAAVPVAVVSKPVLPMKIGKVTLQGGTVNFTDNFVKPNYSARLKQVGGRISGLSSAPESIASLELRGSYDNVAPLHVTARMNPLSAKPYLDLQADIKGIEMTSFSPYSGKYAGYAIEKGKLSLFVKYKIENNQLEAENRVFLDQLTLGDPVESPDATKLPVSLALSLLKNRNGEIDINLPISGSLDDPQFSVGGLVIKVIVNLFVKAVTSPFALLGSLFGGGEELSMIEFEYGRAALAPAALTRLENLAKALIDRPSLKLEVEGRVDVEHDPEGLKSARIDRKVKALKREDMTKKGVESGSLEEIEVSAKEYPELLDRVYRAEKFPKPRNLIGMVKAIPVEEMEKLILSNSTVNEDDLRALGDRRAKAVRDWLIAHEVPPDRVFLLPARLGNTESKSAATEKAKGSRVDFTLK